MTTFLLLSPSSHLPPSLPSFPLSFLPSLLFSVEDWTWGLKHDTIELHPIISSCYKITNAHSQVCPTIPLQLDFVIYKVNKKKLQTNLIMPSLNFLLCVGVTLITTIGCLAHGTASVLLVPLNTVRILQTCKNCLCHHCLHIMLNGTDYFAFY